MAGVGLGGVVGYSIMRFTFVLMNEVLKPSDYLRRAVENELKTHMPLTHVFSSCENKLDEGKLDQAVQAAINLIKDCEPASYDSVFDEDRDQLIQDIREKGAALLEDMPWQNLGKTYNSRE